MFVANSRVQIRLRRSRTNWSVVFYKHKIPTGFRIKYLHRKSKGCTKVQPLLLGYNSAYLNNFLAPSGLLKK